MKILVLFLIFVSVFSSQVKFVSNPDTLNGTAYIKWCKSKFLLLISLDFDGHNIYNLGSKLSCAENSQTFSMALSVAVFFTVLIEFSINRLQKVCQLKNNFFRS